jgi:hypothetical protein
MSILFNIEDDYLKLVNQIEELEGEITPELEEALKINAKELESKIKAYHHIIQQKNANIMIIKDEKDRLSNLEKVNANIINKLKNNILYAVKTFGYEGKSGNKKLDYDTVKLYTKSSEKIEVDVEKYITDAFTLKNTIIPSLEFNSKVNFGDEGRAYRYEIPIQFDINDIANIASSITDNNIRRMFVDYFSPVISKTEIKKVIKEGFTINNCKLIEEDNVIIK